jgi:hypothetical protein
MVPAPTASDSELRNPWDEICVQVQFEESFVWHAYEETITAFLAGEVHQLRQFERDAIWLRTEAGTAWDCDDDPHKPAEPPTCDPDITDYILHKYLITAAESWSNSRIRAYLERYERQC